jgi:hypothetical protein
MMMRISFFLGLVALAGAVRAAEGTHPFPRLGSYERFVAIDNACGWPIVTLQPDGTLTCVIWPHPLHGYTEGAAECWVSRDGGRFWSKSGVPVPWTPTRNRMNVAAGLRADGGYVALISGWDKRLPEGWRPEAGSSAPPQNYFRDANTLNPVPAVSLDQGRTWKQFPEFDGRQPSGQGIIPFGRIAPLSDGTIGVMMYRDEVGFFTSADGGATWTRRGQLSEGRQYNETAWLQLDNGDLFAASRAYGASNGGQHAGVAGEFQHLDGFRSKDGGRTWTREGALTLPMQHPADLTRLPDGRIVLSYGVRNQGDWGINVRFGDPTATVWSAPLRLVDLEGSTDRPDAEKPSRDGGYPSTVVLADGTLVTAYYTRGVPAHQRYHVGVVRWTLPPAAKKVALP